MCDYIKKPCKHCPYRNDIKPFLTPYRQEELAYAATNPYNTFSCHKTIDHDDDGEQVDSGIEKQCAGFLTLMAQECGEKHMPEGFVPSYDIVFSEAHEMAEALEYWEDAE